MSEKLIVKNFGPIKHVELDIKKVNVLIGEQGTGKSALVRLLYLFTSEGFLFGDDENKETLIDWYGFFFREDTSISFSTQNYYVIYENGKFSVVFQGPNQEILERFFYISQDFLVRHNFKLEDEYYSLKKWFSENIGSYSYVPAERLLISNVSEIRFSNIKKGNLDQYIIDFSNNFAQSVKITELDIPYLNNVKYRRENNKDVVFVNGERLFLYQTSSGFQSTIPMTVTVEYFVGLKDKISFIIEEPELNLFPATQNELIKYLVEKTTFSKNGLFLATHSPYTLTSLNNLMYAYQIGQKNPNEVGKIIDKKYWINPDDVSAYMMLSNGEREDIFDREEGMIKAEKIDSASTEINQAFDELLNIEFKKKKLNTE